jgi:hypothetical protein
MALSPQLQKMLASAGNKYSGMSDGPMKLKDGRNTLRFVVDPASTDQFWADLGVHWIKADENAKPICVIGDCETVYQQPSLVNAAIDSAISSAIDEDSKKVYESWRARKSVLVPVIVRPATDEITILELTPTTFGKVLDLIGLYSEAGQDLLDPVAGLDIVISRSGKALNTDYAVMVSPTPPSPLPAGIFTKLPDMAAFVEKKYFRGEEQKALNAIAQIAGITVPRIGAIGSTPTAALSSPAVAVAGAYVAPAAVVAPVAVVAEVDPSVALAAAAAATAAAERRAVLLAKQKELADMMASLEEEPASAPAPAPVPIPAASDTISNLSESDQDAILAELDLLK